MNLIQKCALILTIIGAINWGLIGIFNYNLVEALCGAHSFLTMAIYILVGLSGLINIMLLFSDIHQ